MSFQRSLFDDDLEPALPAGSEAGPSEPEPAFEPALPAALAAEAAVDVSAQPVAADDAVLPPWRELLDDSRAEEDDVPLPDEPPPDPEPENSGVRSDRATAVPANPTATATSVSSSSIGPPGTGNGILPKKPEGAARANPAELLDQVRSVAIACTRCDLSRTRTNVVFGEGNPAAPLVLVGEGPGENEDASGRPFVGRAGKLLDQVLRRNGMTRDHVYICNVVKCRAADMVAGRYQNRQPSPEEIAACSGWLEEQLRIIKPLVIVCVGGPAASTVIHKGFRITSERGRWFTNSTYAPWAMAVFHPAYVLRLDGPSYGAALETLVEDIGKARQKVIEVKRQLKEAAAAAPPPRSLLD